MMEKLVYAIVSVKSDPDRLSALLSGIRGISGVDLGIILCGEIAAVVSDLDNPGLTTDHETAIEFAGVIEIGRAHV